MAEQRTNVIRRFWRGPKSEVERLERAKRRREQARKGLALLPSALTLGNLVCGFGAIIKIATLEFTATGALTAAAQDSVFMAGILILLAMIFDALDGRVARLTKSTSDFGGELDSLCDAVTFGLTPGLMVVLLNPLARTEGGATFWGKAAWVFGVAYACGAILRLARFNVENTHDESAHQSFKGLPSPAAAGVIAGFVLFQNFLVSARGERFFALDLVAREALARNILLVLPCIALGLGALMISRLRYSHLVNVYLRGRTRFDHLQGILVLGAIGALFVVYFPELLAALFFGLFALSGPARGIFQRLSGAPSVEASGVPANPALPNPGEQAA